MKFDVYVVIFYMQVFFAAMFGEQYIVCGILFKNNFL